MEPLAFMLGLIVQVLLFIDDFWQTDLAFIAGPWDALCGRSGW